MRTKDQKRIDQVVHYRNDKKLTFREIAKIMFPHSKNPANQVKTIWRWYGYYVGSLSTAPKKEQE